MAHGNEWPLFTVHITRGREYLRICSVSERFSITSEYRNVGGEGGRREGVGWSEGVGPSYVQPIAENANSQHAISFTINSAVAFARLAEESYKPKLNITDFCSPACLPFSFISSGFFVYVCCVRVCAPAASFVFYWQHSVDSHFRAAFYQCVRWHHLRISHSPHTHTCAMATEPLTHVSNNF